MPKKIAIDALADFMSKAHSHCLTKCAPLGLKDKKLQDECVRKCMRQLVKEIEIDIGDEYDFY